MLTMMLRDLCLSPVKTLLTALSMLIGILAVIAASLVGTIGGTFLTATNAQLSGRAATYAVSLDLPYTLSADDIATLAQQAEQVGGGTMAPVVDLSRGLTIVRADHPGAMIPESVTETVFTTADYRGVFLLPIVSGHWFSPANAEAGLQVVTNQAGEAVFGTTGDAIAITAASTATVTGATVTGVVNDGYPSPRLYINAVSFARLAPQLWNPSSITVYWHPADAGLTADDAASAVSDLAYDVAGGKSSGVQRVDNNGLYADVLAYLRLAFMLCGMLLLFVAALGLVNIGLSDVEQRSRELLIRRALGASRLNMMALVAGSSIILSLIVAGLAIGLSAALVASIPALLPPDSPIPAPAYPTAAAQAALAASVVTALVGSAAPAFKAARLEPAMALR